MFHTRYIALVIAVSIAYGATYPNSTINVMKCETTEDCRKDCTCIPTDSAAGSICANQKVGEAELLKCQKCNDSSACPGSICVISGVCKTCLDRVQRLLIEECACISTAWLRKHGLLHAQLGKSNGASKVLCIPDSNLPCGTPGHILRDQSGTLVTYNEVCAERGDCIQSNMQVSQIRHDVDWSSHKSHGLELTSLSAHPSSSTASPSRIVAHAADLLNRYGLGLVVNMISQPSTIVYPPARSLCSRLQPTGTNNLK